jgi:iron complex transport system substrate-binding protein
LLCAVVFVCAVDGAPARSESRQERPRIVSLAPHLTEMAFAAGAGERVVGTVEYSDHPDAARRIVRIGDAFRLDFERVLALEPDVVLACDSGTPAAAVQRLQALGLNVKLIATARLQDVASALRTIGDIAGVQASAEKAAAEYEAGVVALRVQYAGRPTLSVFLQVNDRPLYTINGRHIMSEVLDLCGGRNVFAGLKELAPVVGVESVIAADPQVILATDDAVLDARAYWARWRRIEAVRQDSVYTISSDRLARPTPRLVEGAREVCRALDAARARRARGDAR